MMIAKDAQDLALRIYKLVKAETKDSTEATAVLGIASMLLTVEDHDK